MKPVFRVFFGAIICLTASLTPEHHAFGDPYWVFFAPAPGWQPGDPVAEDHISAVSATGAAIRTVSRYFNAVSVETGHDTGFLTALDCVDRVTPVRRFSRIPRHTNPAAAGAEKVSTVSSAAADEHLLSYGISYRQLNALDIPSLHDRGLSGNGVVIGVLDSGFPIEGTSCLKDIDISHKRNFIDGSENVGGDSHGAHVLACIAGASPGKYYGSAFGATFLLALTEDVGTETRADEDRWVAGIEWCDSLGADIISSSLVYNEFDTVEESYEKSDMDGLTSLVAQAAEIAWSRGMLVVNAAGNEGGNSWGIITTPADAEHVLAVGALKFTGETELTVAAFSSTGPTADGRIKPDLMAPGESVYIPLPGTTDYYYTSFGTSLATPLVSGLCALLMEAHPDWSPADIVAILKETAADAGDPGPDNRYGWGIPDGVDACDYVPVAVAGSGSETGAKSAAPAPVLLDPFPNPFNAAVTVPFRLEAEGMISVSVYDVTGRVAARLLDGRMPAGVHRLHWRGTDFSSGVYFVSLAAPGYRQTEKILLVK